MCIRDSIHVFDQWCHLATVHNEAELEAALQSRQTLAFDLDSYRLLLKHLLPSGKRQAGLFLLAGGVGKAG